MTNATAAKFLPYLETGVESDRARGYVWGLWQLKACADRHIAATTGKTRRAYQALAGRIDGYLFDFAGGAF